MLACSGLVYIALTDYFCHHEDETENDSDDEFAHCLLVQSVGVIDVIVTVLPCKNIITCTHVMFVLYEYSELCKPRGALMVF